MGKHPAAADYISVRNGPSILDAVADWMTKGYESLHASGDPVKGPYSWRFWLRGVKKGSLICGLGRDSSDRIGRPYPLFIIGEGPLRKWEQQWPLLPAWLAATWERMEGVAAHRHDTLQELADAVRRLGSPGAETVAAEPPVEADIPSDRLDACRTELQRSGRAMIALNDHAGGDDPMTSVLAWHGFLKRCCPDIPRAVFLGGNPERIFLAVIQQPLATADFIRLWRA